MLWSSIVLMNILNIACEALASFSFATFSTQFGFLQTYRLLYSHYIGHISHVEDPSTMVVSTCCMSNCNSLLRHINLSMGLTEYFWNMWLYSGVVYTTDHEVVPRPYKLCDWLLNSSWDHFGLHQGKNVKVTVEFEVPKRHVLRPKLSIDIVQRVLQWERQKRCSSRKRQGLMAKKCCYNF